MNPKVIAIINSCRTHAQLDTCGQWIEYIYDAEGQIMANSIIQSKRNEIDRVAAKFSPDHIAHVQALES